MECAAILTETTGLGDKKAALEQQYGERAAPYKAEMASLTDGVQAFAEANRVELTDNHKTKTVDFGTGLVKWRVAPKSVKVTGVAAVRPRLCAGLNVAAGCG